MIYMYVKAKYYFFTRAKEEEFVQESLSIFCYKYTFLHISKNGKERSYHFQFTYQTYVHTLTILKRFKFFTKKFDSSLIFFI